MANIVVAPFALTDATLTIGADGYEAHVSAVEFVPSSSVVTWKGLTPTSVHTFAANASWTCNLAFAQDWATENSLSRYLFEHEGDQVAMTFHPTAGGPGFSASVSITVISCSVCNASTTALPT